MRRGLFLSFILSLGLRAQTQSPDGFNSESDENLYHQKRQLELKELQNSILIYEFKLNVNPFLESISELIQMSVLPSRGKLNHISKDIQSLSSMYFSETQDANIEVFLPSNRCETGFIRWGDDQRGYRKCRVLGRGESFFASLEELEKAKKAQPKTYKDWIIAELPEALNKTDVDEDERLGKGPQYSHCLYRPEKQFNGASVSYRENSSIGIYDLDTGEKIHSGKEKWGKKDDKFLIPIRMNKIKDARNDKYANEGRLIQRDNFWLHSHKNIYLNSPLEGLSTWGCIRMPTSCMIEMQEWVYELNESGIKPKLSVFQNDAVVDNFESE